MNATANQSAHRDWGEPETVPFEVDQYVWLMVLTLGQLSPHRSVGIVESHAGDGDLWVRVGLTLHRRPACELRHSRLLDDARPQVFAPGKRGMTRPDRGVA